MCLNNLTCARPEVAVGTLEELGAGVRIDRRDFPRRERYRHGTEVIRVFVAREGEDDVVNIGGWGAGSATYKVASDSPRHGRGVGIRMTFVAQAGELARDSGDHSGRCNRPFNGLQAVAENLFRSCFVLLDVNREIEKRFVYCTIANHRHRNDMTGLMGPQNG